MLLAQVGQNSKLSLTVLHKNARRSNSSIPPIIMLPDYCVRPSFFFKG